MKAKKLVKMFRYINRELFDDFLDMPYIFALTNKQCKQMWPEPIDGIFVRDKTDVCIGIHKHLTNNEAFDTMVHEMIHQYLVETKNYWGHGKKFKKMCRKAIDIFYYNML